MQQGGGGGEEGLPLSTSPGAPAASRSKRRPSARQQQQQEGGGGGGEAGRQEDSTLSAGTSLEAKTRDRQAEQEGGGRGWQSPGEDLLEAGIQAEGAGNSGGPPDPQLPLHSQMPASTTLEAALRDSVGFEGSGI